MSLPVVRMRNGAVWLALIGGRTWPFAGSDCSGAVKAVGGESWISIGPAAWDRSSAVGASDNGSDRANRQTRLSQQRPAAAASEKRNA